MTDHNKMPGRGTSSRARKSKNSFTTRSGQTIKINRSLTDKIKAKRDAYARRRAQRLAGMPKSRIKRFFYRLHPKRMYKYWFSREGGIMALKLTGIGIIAGFLLLVGLFAYFRKDLPNLRDISGQNLGGSIRYYDRTGKTLLWEDFDAVKRIPVDDKDISEYVKKATIAIEDKDFFKHGGFDTRGILRAAANNFTGGTTQGASTITQQLVRLTQKDVGKEQTYKRKIKELILSVELERSYTKDEILTGYLNTAPFGSVQYGVESATRDYFQKSAKQLTLDESAFLAAIPQSPSYYSPYGSLYNPEKLIGRQHYVLQLMEEQGMITSQERDAAKKVNTLAKVKKPKSKYSGIRAPWFVLTAKEYLETEFSADTVERGGWKVTTTLDLDIQRKAEEAVRNGMAQVRDQKGDVAAFGAEDVETGQMVALVGGPDFGNSSLSYSEVNYARQPLPPGSSFKPYDYLALIEKTNDFGAGSVLYDSYTSLPGYECDPRVNPAAKCLRDYDYQSRTPPGPLTLRYSLGGSRNIPAVKAMLTVGPEQTIKVAESLGLASGYKCYLPGHPLTPANETSCGGSSAIGDGAYLRLDEHVHAYGTLARMGKKLPQTYFLKIEDSGGKTLTEWKQDKGEQVVRDEAAYIVADMMSDPKASYLPNKLHRFNGNKGQWKFAAKTGTTNDSKDGWMMGFSSKYAAGVWVGYHNRQVELRGYMETMTQPILQGFMDSVHRDLKPKDWKRPAGIQTLPAFVVRTHVGVASIEPSPSTDLFPSWFKKKAISNKRQTIDIVSNRLATDCTPGRARKDVFGGDANSFSGDRFVNGSTSGVINTNAKDNVHKCEDIKPSVRLEVNPAGGNKYQLVADVTKGTHPLSSARFPGTITFSVDGKQVHSRKISSSGTVTYTYTATSGGSHKASVVVVDSVLYDDSDNADFTSAGGGGALTITSADGSGATTFVSWTGGSSAVTIYTSGGVVVCSGGGTGSCSDPIHNYSGQDIYAEDGNGNRSEEVEVD